MSGSLDHTPADVLRWSLIALSVGTDPAEEDDWPIYSVNEPNAPDDSITLTNTAGEIEGRVHRTGQTQEHHGVQVMIRGSDDRRAWVKVNAVKTALEESIHNTLVDVGTSQYIVYAATRRSGPIPLGREPATNRYLCSLNYVAAVKQLS